MLWAYQHLEMIFEDGTFEDRVIEEFPIIINLKD
jgi:hypothetical protein